MSIRITGMNSGLDTDSMVKELVNAYEEQGEKYTKARTKTEWKQEIWKELNTKVKSFYSKYASSMRFSTQYNKMSTTASDSSKVSVVAGENATVGSQTLKINKLAVSGYLTGGKLNDVTGSTKLSELVGDIGEGTVIKINRGAADADGNYDESQALEISVNSDTTVSEFVSKINAISDINASFDENNSRIFVSSKSSGTANDFSLEGNTGTAADILSALKLTDASGGSKIAAVDAAITLNGVDYTSSSNSFSINGQTITVKGTTAENEELTLTTDVDIESVYSSIKNFFKEYNTLINELDKLYNADDVTIGKNKYEPLTDDEKEAMSDTEIEKWETKIKDSLLSGDSDVSTLASAMRNSMLKTYEVDGKTYSLSSFGIETLSYFEAAENEKNAFHIYGDEDDDSTSGETDKLKSMIASNPSAVSGFFTQLIGGLYDSMYKIQSESDNYTSFGSFYGDKRLQTEYDTQDEQVSKWEDYVAEIEERYYSQFTAMETALGELQSQQSSLSQLLGS